MKTLLTAAALTLALATTADAATWQQVTATGGSSIDEVSKSGLQGLTLFLAQRTALEAGDPVGLDPARDELSFFPLIYWPISPNAPRPCWRRTGN